MFCKTTNTAPDCPVSVCRDMSHSVSRGYKHSRRFCILRLPLLWELADKCVLAVASAACDGLSDRYFSSRAASTVRLRQTPASSHRIVNLRSCLAQNTPGRSTATPVSRCRTISSMPARTHALMVAPCRLVLIRLPLLRNRARSRLPR